MSLLSWRNIIVVVILVLTLTAFLFAPVVPYSVSFADPHNVDPRQFDPCVVAVLNSTKAATDFEHCYEISALPPSSVKGYGSLAYYFSGLSTGPFPSMMLASQGNSTYLLHFGGPRLSYIEGPIFSGGMTVTLNPSDVIRIDNISLAQWAFGRLNFSARITNIGTKTLWSLGVAFAYPSYGVNESLTPLRVYSGQQVGYPTLIPPGASITATTFVNASSILLADQSYPMTLEVTGRTATGANAPAFLFVDTIPISYPGIGLNGQWVQAFIQAMDQRRGGAPLVENHTLDEFAAFRYNTLVLQFQISDYNFTNDYNRYFGSSNAAILEEILYPGGRDPATYPDYLQKNSIIHYTDLLNPLYTQYGYFFGTGPTVEVGPGCSATEVPGPNINITKYAIDHGCSYVISDEIWFILILGN